MRVLSVEICAACASITPFLSAINWCSAGFQARMGCAEELVRAGEVEEIAGGCLRCEQHVGQPSLIETAMFVDDVRIQIASRLFAFADRGAHRLRRDPIVECFDGMMVKLPAALDRAQTKFPAFP